MKTVSVATDFERFGPIPDIVVLLAVVAALVFAMYLVRKSVKGSRPGFRRWKPRLVAAAAASARPFASSGDLSDPANQMRFVSRAGYRTKPLLNREEYPVLLILERTVADLGRGCRVMAQTSLGEVIQPDGQDLTPADRDGAFRSINSKRLDFAVIDPRGHLILAVEYQGSGHYHQASFMRDAVKREVLRKAGVPLLEVPVGYDAAAVAAQVRNCLAAPRAQASR